MEIIHHTGQIINTGKKCVILMIELPEKPGYSLIAETDSLPERIHDPLMSILTSNEAQNSRNLADVLHRRLMPDSNISILLELHNLGYLRAEPSENIYLIPRNNIRIKASDVIKEMKKIKNADNNNAEIAAEETQKIMMDNFHVNNMAAISEEKNLEIAKNMLIQASLLEEDAKKLREKAYNLAPSLAVKKSKKKENTSQNKIKNEIDDK